MTYEHGRILAVNEVTLGSELVGDTLAGVLSLTVEDPVDFDEDGGQLVINGQVIEYTTYDDDTGEITLSEALAADAEEGDAVRPYDPYYGVVSTEKIAQVELDGDDYNTDPIEATIAHHLVKEIGEGIRGLRGESCLLELDGDEWRIVDVLGLGSPSALGMQAEANDAYTITAADVTAGTATMTLSHTPIDESVKGFWGVLPQEPTEYTVSGRTVTWPLDGVAVEGDRLWVHYWYRVAGVAPEASAGLPSSVVGSAYKDALSQSETRPYPTGTQSGDLLLLLVATPAVLAHPGDWTHHGTVSATGVGSGQKMSVFTKVAGAETSVTTTLDETHWQNGLIVTFRGAAVGGTPVTDSTDVSPTYTTPAGAPWNVACLMTPYEPGATTVPTRDAATTGAQAGLAVAHTADGSAIEASTPDNAGWAVVMLNLVGA